MKTCTKCGETKPFTEFYKHKISKDGYRSQCKSCRKQYRQENREAINERERRHYQENKEAIKERKRRHYQENKETIAERARRRYQENKETINEYQRQYYQENKEAIKEYNRQYREENKGLIREISRRYNQENKKAIKERKRRHYQENKEAIKERKRRYREERAAKQPGCIYQIVNSVNGIVYVGETTRGEIRWSEHLSDLRGNYHRNPHLQADFNEFGEDVFEWSIIQELPKDKEVLVQEETNTIQRLLAEGKELYNITLN